MTSGFTLTGEGGSLNSFNVTPIEVYRVYVDGRKDELVRGVDMIGTPLSMFSNIAAAGNSISTFTGVCGAESGWVPVSASSPMIFVSKIETQRRQKEDQQARILPAPELKNTEVKVAEPTTDVKAKRAADDKTILRRWLTSCSAPSRNSSILTIRRRSTWITTWPAVRNSK